MSQYIGFRCDGCEKVIDTAERHKETTKIEGPNVQGEYSRDLCPECIWTPPKVTLRPLRRRRTKVEREAELV